MSFGREYAGNICEIMRWEKLPSQEKASLELGSMGLGATQPILLRKLRAAKSALC